MNIEYAAGVVLGCLVGIVLVAVVLKLTKTDHSSKCKYDERQQSVRGKGFKYGFFAMIIVNMLIIILKVGRVPVPVQMEVQTFLSILVGVLVYAVYSIWHDGYFALNENKKRVLVAFGVIGLANIGIGIANIMSGEMLQNGQLNYQSINLLCGIMFVLLFLVIALKDANQSREVE